MRVLIADDTALLRQGLARLLTEAGIEVCRRGRRRSGTPAAGRGTATRCGGGRHPDAAHQHRRGPRGRLRDPQRCPGVGVLVLSQYVEPAYALRLVEGQQGGCGYLLKDKVMDADELVSALERVAAGELVVDRELIDSLLSRRRDPDPLDELTDREHEVLALMAEGLTDRGIGERLWISTNTVETHVRHILQKLNLRHDDARNRRVQAVLIQLSD